MSRFHVRRVEIDDKVEENNYIRYENSSTFCSSYSDDNPGTTTIRYNTRDALPSEDHYRSPSSIHPHIPRPTIDQLLADKTLEMTKSLHNISGQPVNSVRYGWFQGVYLRCLLSFFGSVLFLRLPWIVGEAGIALTICIILLSHLIATVTALSMSAICTNGLVRAGGTYFMISRSLGPEFGGAIGIVFALGNTVAAAMNCIAFSESLLDFIKSKSESAIIIDGGINDVRLTSCITVCLLTAVTLIGTICEGRSQLVMFVVILVALLDFFLGSFLYVENRGEEKSGFIGWDFEIASENFGPDFRSGESFFSIFGLFFPTVTGILAGASMSGDLQEPQTDIPKGTFLTLITTTIMYLLVALTIGSTVVRDAPGAFFKDYWLMNCTAFKAGHCPRGLQNNFHIIELIALNPTVIMIAIFAVSLSSALSALMSAPIIFQTICKDNIFPSLKCFGVVSKSGKPYRSIFLVFIGAAACCVAGNINVIAPFITNFFLSEYCLINFACFHASYTQKTGFRPAFRFYNPWLSLVGAIICMVIMTIISYKTALGTFLFIATLYVLIRIQNPHVNWGTSPQAQNYVGALKSVIKLNNTMHHVKNYRPQILVLSGHPGDRTGYVEFASLVTSDLSLMICGSIFKNKLTFQMRDIYMKSAERWLEQHKIDSFFTLTDDNENMEKAVEKLLDLTGIGKLRPNILMIGFKQDWMNSQLDEIVDYFKVINLAFSYHVSLIILKTPEHSSCFENSSQNTHEHTGLENHFSFAKSYISTAPLLQYKVWNSRHNGFIDVWWLYDDGGLTMLIPFILTKRTQFQDCQLRVLTLAHSRHEIEQQQINLAALLAKFRIDCSEVEVISDITKPPKPETVIEFQQLIQPWTTGEVPVIKNDTLTIYKDKTSRCLRIAEHLRRKSCDAALVIVTMPVPKHDTCPAPLYLAWLEMMSRIQPPLVFIRGNQDSVLTFYT